MNLKLLRGRRWPLAVLLGLAALAIGSIFGTAGSGTAAIAVAPSNTALPTISGTAQPAATLSAASGTWSGTSPFGFSYAWSRCDKNGAACAVISGASSSTYVIQDADVGKTVRVAVTASNSDGSAQASSAATPVIGAPSNTAPPTISGTTQAGSTLTAANGTWAGATPLSYAYAWSRCDQSNCGSIAGATASTYALQAADTGTTVKVTVTATNAAGAADATSANTAVIGASTPTPTTGCPSGTGTIQIGDLAPPARLAIDQQTITPGVVTPSAATIQVHARITACGGRPVQGALVYVTAVPYNQYTVPHEGTTGSDGTVVLTQNQLSGFPAARQQQLLVLFFRARKPGEPILGGISTRRLVSFPVSLKK